MQLLASNYFATELKKVYLPALLYKLFNLHFSTQLRLNGQFGQMIFFSQTNDFPQMPEKKIAINCNIIAHVYKLSQINYAWICWPILNKMIQYRRFPDTLNYIYKTAIKALMRKTSVFFTKHLLEDLYLKNLLKMQSWKRSQSKFCYKYFNGNIW